MMARVTLLDALLEGFDSAAHPRGPLGRWIATFHHPVHGRVTSPVQARSSSDAWEKAKGMGSGTVQSLEPHDARARAIVAGEGFDPVTKLGRQGTAARERGASSLATETADTRDKLKRLPVGQSYGLHGPRGQIGQVQRTADGWRVQGPTVRHDKVHATGDAAALHAMKLQRSALADARSADVMKRNWSGRQEVARMNARQVQRGKDERQRAAQIAARAGQGAGPPVFSSGRLITAPQHKRLASVVADIHANAWQDRPYMNSLISRSLRDSGHVMGMSPGWMDRLHTNHASQLIKDLERLAKHGPGELARESAPAAVLGALLEGH